MTRAWEIWVGPSRPGRWYQGAGRRLTAPVDIASLVVVRILVGLILTWEVTRRFQGDGLWWDYVQPAFHFSYFGWEFLRPWPEPWLYLHMALLGLCGLGVASGAVYRLTAPLACLGFGLFFLWDQTHYLNHHYLLWLLLLLLALLPAHRSLALDVAWGLAAPQATVPAWVLYLLRLQVAVVYLYGGVAKLDADWLAGWPLRDWLRGRGHYALVGPLFQQGWFALAMAWGGMLYDLTIVPLLSWRRTRPSALLWSLAFHGLNKLWFSIGVFPVLALALVPLFCDPSWPRRWLRWDPPARPAARAPRVCPVLVGGVIVCLALWQLLFPLRHYLYPGDVTWTEEGHKYSWRMKLRDKDGAVRFWLVDRRSGQGQVVDLSTWLTPDQLDEMAGRPRLILQVAHWIRDFGPVPPDQAAVYVDTCVALNQRPCQVLVDPGADLAAVQYGIRAAPWLRPPDPALRPGLG